MAGHPARSDALTRKPITAEQGGEGQQPHAPQQVAEEVGDGGGLGAERDDDAGGDGGGAGEAEYGEPARRAQRGDDQGRPDRGDADRWPRSAAQVDAMAAWNSQDQFVWGLRALLTGTAAG
ncbi:hypothetical protein ACTWPB_11215 [Nocardia sp. IBHARD005]|uniref:hypothetical protein n=1 Tax=Nocardia sp. IBHARD005 TaxID=3457765 RepID=UPI0040591505